MLLPQPAEREVSVHQDRCRQLPPGLEVRRLPQAVLGPDGNHLPRHQVSIRKWILVVFEMCAAKNGVAAREIERRYDLSPKSAWFMTQRIREAMKREPLAGLLSGTIVADETWIGGKPRNRHRQAQPARNVQVLRRNPEGQDSGAVPDRQAFTANLNLVYGEEPASDASRSTAAEGD